MSSLPPMIQIRRMTLADLDEVHALDERCFSLPWPKRSYIFEIEENKAGHCWVAVQSSGDRERVVGMIVCWLLMEDIHVATIATDQDFRRQGIGRALLLQAFEELSALGGERATLEVRENNLTARQMYLGMGFEVVGRRPKYYSDTREDAILMTLPRLGLAEAAAAD